MSYDKAADTEVTRGHRGSANLRIESFLTLRVLVAKVLVTSIRSSTRAFA